jgi:hypothetical protein
MKKIFVIYFVLLTNSSLVYCQSSILNFCQVEGESESLFLLPMYWERLTDSRAEAMGKTVCTGRNINTSYYNPAALANANGLELSSTYVEVKDDGNPTKMFLYNAIAGKVSKYVNLELSRFAYHVRFNDLTTPRIPWYNLFSVYTIGVASEPIDDLHIGFNGKLMTVRLHQSSLGESDNKTDYIFTSDFGLIKDFRINKSNVLTSAFSITNYTSTEYDVSEYYGESVEIDVPVVGTIGLAYEFQSSKKYLDTLSWFSSIVQVEYGDNLISRYRSSIKGGLEVSLLDLLSVRIGYFFETQDAAQDLIYKSAVSGVTFGVGLQLPFNRLYKRVPFSVYFDFARLPEESRYVSAFSYENRMFNSLNLRLNWLF